MDFLRRPANLLLRTRVLLAASLFALAIPTVAVAVQQADRPQTSASADEQPVAATSTTASDVDFAKDVFPILQQHCIECHGEAKQEGDLRMDQSEILLTEDFVVPGDSENSRLYEVLISEDEDRMPPPDEADALPDGKVSVIKSWIEQGARWSDISALLDAPAVVVGTPVEPAIPDLSPIAAFWVRVWRAFGDAHPAVVHFPIALLAVGGLFALFGLRGSYRCSDFAFYCLWMGSLSAILASLLGWSYAWNEGHHEDPFLFDQQAALFWHRWTGVLLAILSFLVAVWATIARRRDPDDGTLWKLCLIVLAGFTIYVGHAGGDLTHRRGYRRIYELFGLQAPANPATSTESKQSPGDITPNNAAQSKVD